MKTPPINMKYPFATVAGEKEVKLRRREWLLLNYMLYHRGELLTAYQIYTYVWELTPVVIRKKTNSAICTNINRLRDALPELIIARVHRRGWALL